MKNPTTGMMKKLMAMSLVFLTLSSCSRSDHDPWFNTYYLQEGDLYVDAVSGFTSNEEITFSDCYIDIRSVENATGLALYEDAILTNAPNSYWLGMNPPEYSVRKMKWNSSYFENMPGFKYAYTNDEVIRFLPIEYKKGGSSTAWRTEYASVYEKTSLEYPIYFDMQLHKEDVLLTEAKGHFFIEGVCDLYMAFHFASIY